jgi:flagellar basal body-associated protein FliL
LTIYFLRIKIKRQKNKNEVTAMKTIIAFLIAAAIAISSAWFFFIKKPETEEPETTTAVSQITSLQKLKIIIKG